MICMFCSEEMAEGEIRCPVCGFTHMNFTEEGGSEIIKSMTEAYKKRRLGGIQIELVSHNYSLENGNLKDEGKSTVLLADASELERDSIKWCDREFYGTEDEKDVTIELSVGGEEKTSRSLSLRVPPSEQLRVGLKLESGLRAVLAAGTPEKYVLSEEFELSPR